MHQDHSQSVSLWNTLLSLHNLMIFCSWFERITITVIIINCITLGSFEPCQDLTVCRGKCQVFKVRLWSAKPLFAPPTSSSSLWFLLLSFR